MADLPTTGAAADQTTPASRQEHRLQVDACTDEGFDGHKEKGQGTPVPYRAYQSRAYCLVEPVHFLTDGGSERQRLAEGAAIAAPDLSGCNRTVVPVGCSTTSGLRAGSRTLECSAACCSLILKTKLLVLYTFGLKAGLSYLSWWKIG